MFNEMKRLVKYSTASFSTVSMNLCYIFSCLTLVPLAAQLIRECATFCELICVSDDALRDSVFITSYMNDSLLFF